MSNEKLIDFESLLPGTAPVIEIGCEVQSEDMIKPVKFKVLWERLEHDENKELADEMRADTQQLMVTRRKLQKYDAYGTALERGEVIKEFEDIDIEAEMPELYSALDELEGKRIVRIRQNFKGVKGFPAVGGKKIDILPDEVENIEGLLEMMLKWDHYIEGLAESHEKSAHTKKRNEAKAKN